MKKFIVLTVFCLGLFVSCEKSDMSLIEKDLKKVIKKYDIEMLYVYTTTTGMGTYFITSDFKFYNGFLYCKEENNGKERYLNLNYLTNYSVEESGEHHYLKLFFPDISYYW